MKRLAHLILALALATIGAMYMNGSAALAQDEGHWVGSVPPTTMGGVPTDVKTLGCWDASTPVPCVYDLTGRKVDVGTLHNGLKGI